MKKAARQLIEKFFAKMTQDFHSNKRVIDEVALIPSKGIRNKIAGYATLLMKRIQKGPVRGISLRLQEEERERRMEFIPKETEFKFDERHIDEDTREMIIKLGLEKVLQN